MDSELKSKLDSKIESFIQEFKPKDDGMLYSTDLMNIYKVKLNEFALLVKSEPKEDFIDEMLFELKESLTPAVIEATDGTDEIITSLLIVELAKIIYQHESQDINISNTPNTDGRSLIRRGTIYFYGDFQRNSQAPVNYFFKTLGKHIYRTSNLDKNTGCLVLIASMVGIIISLSI